MKRILRKVMYFCAFVMLIVMVFQLTGCGGGGNQYGENDIPHHDPVAWCANVSEYAAAGRCDGVDTSGYVYEKNTPPIQNLLNKF